MCALASVGPQLGRTSNGVSPYSRTSVSQVIWGGDGSHVEVWPNAEPIVSWCCKPCLSLREFGYPDSESFTGVWHNKITRNSHCAFWLGFLHCARELPGGGGTMHCRTLA